MIAAAPVWAQTENVGAALPRDRASFDREWLRVVTDATHHEPRKGTGHGNDRIWIQSWAVSAQTASLAEWIGGTSRKLCYQSRCVDESEITDDVTARAEPDSAATVLPHDRTTFDHDWLIAVTSATHHELRKKTGQGNDRRWTQSWSYGRADRAIDSALLVEWIGGTTRKVCVQMPGDPGASCVDEADIREDDLAGNPVVNNTSPPPAPAHVPAPLPAQLAPAPSPQITTASLEPQTSGDVVPFIAEKGGMMVNVLVGGHAVQMIIDTGATTPTIGATLAAQLIEEGHAQEAGAGTATLADGSMHLARFIYVDALTLGNHTATHVLVGVVDADPLLGLSVLNSIGKFSVDAAHGVLSFN